MPEIRPKTIVVRGVTYVINDLARKYPSHDPATRAECKQTLQSDGMARSIVRSAPTSKYAPGEVLDGGMRLELIAELGNKYIHEVKDDIVEEVDSPEDAAGVVYRNNLGRVLTVQDRVKTFAVLYAEAKDIGQQEAEVTKAKIEGGKKGNLIAGNRRPKARDAADSAATPAPTTTKKKTGIDKLAAENNLPRGDLRNEVAKLRIPAEAVTIVENAKLKKEVERKVVKAIADTPPEKQKEVAVRLVLLAQDKGPKFTPFRRHVEGIGLQDEGAKDGTKRWKAMHEKAHSKLITIMNELQKIDGNLQILIPVLQCVVGYVNDATIRKEIWREVFEPIVGISTPKGLFDVEFENKKDAAHHIARYATKSSESSGGSNDADGANSSQDQPDLGD